MIVVNMNRLETIYLAVTASLFFVGCYNDFDTPAPAKVWTDADFSDSKIISIKELKDIFEEAYPGTSGIGQSLTVAKSFPATRLVSAISRFNWSMKAASRPLKSK